MEDGPLTGSVFGNYRLGPVLGRGGMSIVYLAENVRLERSVALKFLAPELAGDPPFRERFIAESRLAAGLEHPNVIPIYEADEFDGRLFIAMRYVRGPTLGDVIRTDGALDPARTVAILTQVAGALDAAHAQGLVHRDVKPPNILLAGPTTSGGPEHAYLSDFGITKRMGTVSGLTHTGQFMGTVDYVAPEQIEGRTVDGRADQYSLGCVAFECLTGSKPFPRHVWSRVSHETRDLVRDTGQPLRDVPKATRILHVLGTSCRVDEDWVPTHLSRTVRPHVGAALQVGGGGRIEER